MFGYLSVALASLLVPGVDNASQLAVLGYDDDAWRGMIFEGVLQSLSSTYALY